MSAVKQRTPKTTPNAPSRHASRHPLLLVVVTLLALWPVVPAEFIPLDDPNNVSQNPDFNPPTLGKIARYWTEPFLNMYAPLTYSAWGGVARLAWMDAVDEEGLQLNPYVFHAVNLLVHLVNVLLVYALLRGFLGQERAREMHDPSAPPMLADPPQGGWAACAGALLFALHPMQVEPVAWVTGFRDLLAAMFSLASLLGYLSHATSSGSKSARSYAMAFAFLLGALLCKPTAVVVPLIAGALDWMLLRRPLRDVGKSIAGLLLLVVPFAILAKRFQSADLTFTPPLWSRPFIAADALSFYAVKLAAPFRVGLDYGRAPQWLLDQPGLGWMWLAIIPLGVAVWMLRRRRWVVAGIVVFVASLLPVLGLTKFDFQHHSTVADRYVYLGMLGPALMLAFLVRQGGRNAAVTVSVVLLLLAARSHMAARTWDNGESIYRATLAANPGSLIANRGLGLIAQSSGRWDAAERYFAAALRTRPDDAVGNFHLGNLYLGTNRPAQAVPHLRVAAAARDQPWVVTNYASALARSGNLAKARIVLEAAIDRDADSAELHATLAAVRFRQGDRAVAAEHYRLALRLKPGFPVAVEGLALVERAPASASMPATQPRE